MPWIHVGFAGALLSAADGSGLRDGWNTMRGHAFVGFGLGVPQGLARPFAAVETSTQGSRIAAGLRYETPGGIRARDPSRRSRVVEVSEHCMAWCGVSGLLLISVFSWAAESVHTVPYVPASSSEGHAGLVRIESRSEFSGEVRVVAVDDAGRRVDAGALTLGSRSAVEFEASALESGDASLGLAGTGPGEGDWRLELSTELDIEARAYARAEGFVTALHDSILVSDEVELSFFNPGSEMDRRSVLRLANAGGEPARVTVLGVDDGGSSGGSVTVELGAWEARSYTATELESGVAEGLSGSLGDGEGRWRLRLSAETGSAYATNLLLDGSGVLSSVPDGMSRGSLHRVSLFPSASDGEGRRGLVRVVNRTAESAHVGIEAFDATDRAHERLELALEGRASSQFDSADLEQGAAENGLSESTGPGEGDWWLELSSESEIEVLSHVDTASGPLSALRGTAGSETAGGMRYEALLRGGSGELRLLNAGGEPVAVRLTGVDDAGVSGGGAELTLAPWSARTLTASALAEGGEGLTGTLGAGTGSWRVTLDTDGEIDVLSLVRGTGGMLSDVSRRGRPAGSPPRTEVVDVTAARPDLRVSAYASDSDLSPNEAFDLTATVGNRGGTGSPATMLRYYRSADGNITTTDTELGTDAVAALAASGTSVESINLTAPAEPGTYYFGACVDAVADEANPSNNCSAAAAVTVVRPAARPDLAVSASSSDAELAPGGSFTLSATVRNWGAADASATTLRYRRSADAVIATSDAELGTDAVGALSASGTSAEWIGLTAPSTAGTYYYGACVDAVANESDASNNCSAAVRVEVVELAPDLAVSGSVDDANPVAGGPLTLSATVMNAGDGSSSATTLRYLRSADAVIATSDVELGTDAVGALSASGTSAEWIGLTVPSTAGTYYYGACVDAVADESDATNNCSAAVGVDVEEPPAPDLTITATLSDSGVPPGDPFTLTAQVRNAGSAESTTTTLRYFRSADGTVTPSDTELDTAFVPTLAAGAVGGARSLELTAPASYGVYHYGACADAVANESDTTNNCSVVSLTVGRPDLAAEVIGISFRENGSGAFVYVNVSNVGTTASAETTLTLYGSNDATASPDDYRAQRQASVSPLEPETDRCYGWGWLHGSGRRDFYYAEVDAVRHETSTDNNESAVVGGPIECPECRRLRHCVSY